MNATEWYTTLLIVMFVSAPCVFLWLFYVSAPYGRYVREGWGPTVPNAFGWLMMEMPAAVVLPMFVLFSHPTLSEFIFLALWEFHYFYRAFIFPFRLKNPRKPMPIIVPLSGMFFNVINGSVNGLSLTVIHHYSLSWFVEPAFLVGTLLFFTGWYINHRADAVLFDLRKPGESGYKIPYGGLYEWISCPNYFGELIEWTGWAIATWSLAGLAFAVWTAANLIPRAIKHHRWYNEHFANYPKNRYAIFYKLV